jgi:hypothetical protein
MGKGIENRRWTQMDVNLRHKSVIRTHSYLRSSVSICGYFLKLNEVSILCQMLDAELAPGL